MWCNRKDTAVSRSRYPILLAVAWLTVGLLTLPGSTCYGSPQQAIPAAASKKSATDSDYELSGELFPDLESLRSELNSEARMLDGVLSKADPQTPPSAIADLLSSELETSRQVEELGNKMLQLMEVHRQRRASRQSSSDQESPPDTDAAGSPARPMTPDHQSSATSSTDDGSEASDLGRTDISHNLQTTTVLDRPPDQLAVADNLFYSGEYALAQELYQVALVHAPAGPSRTWIQFQLASCLKRTSQVGEAQKLLREITATQGIEEVTANARWWLETTERKKKLQEELDILETFTAHKEADNGIDQ